MSLIQEALKRQHEDLGAAARPPAAEEKAPTLKLKPSDGPEQPEQPPSRPISAVSPPSKATEEPSGADAGGGSTNVLSHLPQIPVAAQRGSSKSRKPVLIVGIVVVAVLVVGTGVFLAAKFLLPNTPTPVAPAAAAGTAPAVSPTSSPAFSASIPTSSGQATQQVVRVPSNTGTSVQVPIVVQPQNVATSKPPETVVDKPPKRVPVVWPVLKVNALMKTSKMAAARINNTELVVGDEIDGVLVVAIDADMVTLQYKDETRRLRTGDITK